MSLPLVIWAIFDGSFSLVSWGLKCFPPYVDVGSFDLGSRCPPPPPPPYVGVGLFDWGSKCLPSYISVG